MRIISLNGTWTLSGVKIGHGRRRGWEHLSNPDGGGKLDSFFNESISATVPGDVHLDLLNAGKIEEPLFGRNAQACAWVAEHEWWYRKEFFLGSNPGIHSEIVFQGLDTDADVWLNGCYLGQHQNMFTSRSFDVTGLLQTGKNVLLVRIDAGVEKARTKRLEPYRRITKNDDDTRRVWVRKAQFTFGWDWAPRLLTCGIWRDVELHTWDEAAIRTVKLDSGIKGRDAQLTADVEIEGFGESPGKAFLSLRCSRGSQAAVQVLPVSLSPGRSCISLNLELDNVALWWPRSHGEPNLYDVHVELRKDDGSIVDEYQCRYGFRAVELVKEGRRDGKGQTFYFKVNGVPVFCKGGNWIPADSIPARVSDKRLEVLLREAVKANFNTLRVWGGGYYESKRFYELCDELGMMVWQDFMFACGYYPDDDLAFCQEIKREVSQVVRELRNHPSIIIWCGDNENDWIYQRERSVKPDHIYRGERINKEIIPEVLHSLDPGRPYIPSSPSGDEQDPNAGSSGDQHNWEVTLLGSDLERKADFYRYAQDYGSFLSEFGLLCPPDVKTVREMLPPEEQRVGSCGWEFHNNTLERGVQQATLRKFWGRNQAPLEDYVKMLQAYHAEGLKFALEHFRRRMFDCGGALFWMYNDSWGAIGWSIIDYYLRKKPSYYAVQRALQPTLLSFRLLDNGVEAWLTHDGPGMIEGDVVLRWVSYSGEDEVLYRKQGHIQLPGSTKIKRIPLNPGRHTPDNGLIVGEFCSEGSTITTNRIFLQFPGTVSLRKPRLKVTGERETEGWRIRLASDYFAWMVWIDVGDDECVSDNGFDLLPGQVKEITYQGEMTDLNNLRIGCLNSLCHSSEEIQELRVG